MINLSNLSNTHRPKKKIQRVGRGIGSKRGKTSGRGHKGDKARMGYKTRPGYEGGQLPLYRKLPCRGFSNARFANETIHINLGDIEKLFAEGDIVSLQTLREKGYTSKNSKVSLRILGQGELTKKLEIHASHYSQGAIEKLNKANISYKIEN